MGAIIGIDLGTTNTVVAAIRDGQPIALPDESGSTLIPSIVSFLPSGAVLVGSAARERRLVDATNTIYSIKRLIGRAWSSPEVTEAQKRLPFELREGPGHATFVVAQGETYTLPEISAFVLRKAKSIAELELGEAVDRAVITVPANFNDLQRAATKVAGRVAGLEVLRIINEPTAAALAYGLQQDDSRVAAVFDLGGGTFDFTVLRLTKDVFEVLATAGDSFLGGDDIDAEISERMADRFAAEGFDDPREKLDGRERLREAAEHLKVTLSTEPDASVRLNALGIEQAPAVDFLLTRRDLESASRAVLERAFAVCRDAIKTAGLALSNIDDVLLVGGATKSPYVRRRTTEFFGKMPRYDADPHQVVALGAALHAATLTQARATLSALPVPPPPEGLPSAPAVSQATGNVGATFPPISAPIGQASPETADAYRTKTEPFGNQPTRERRTTAEFRSTPDATDELLDWSLDERPTDAPPRISVTPPLPPLSQAVPDTRDISLRDRKTTGIGLGPVISATPSSSSSAAAPRAKLSSGADLSGTLGLPSRARDSFPTEPELESALVLPSKPQASFRDPITNDLPEATKEKQPFGRQPMVRVSAGQGSVKMEAPSFTRTQGLGLPIVEPKPPLPADLPGIVGTRQPAPPSALSRQAPTKPAPAPLDAARSTVTIDGGKDNTWADLPASAPPSRATAPSSPQTGNLTRTGRGSIPDADLPLVSTAGRGSIPDADLPLVSTAGRGSIPDADLPLVGTSTSRTPFSPRSKEETPEAKLPSWSELLKGDDDTLPEPIEDEPTAIRRNQTSSEQQLAEHAEFELPAPTLEPAPPPQRGTRPASLNEAEIRARYGNLPLIVGGKRVGSTAPFEREDVQPAQTTPEPPPLAAPRAPERLEPPITAAPILQPPVMHSPTTRRDGPAHLDLNRPPPSRSVEKPPLAFAERQPFEKAAARTLDSRPIASEPEPRSSQAAQVRYHSSHPASRQDAEIEAKLPVPDLPPSSRRAPPQTALSAALEPPIAPPQRGSAPSTSSSPLGAPLRTQSLESPISTRSRAQAGTAPMNLGRSAVQPAASTTPATAAFGSTLATLKEPAAPKSDRGPALLIDVTPHSLCVETAGGYTDVLVSRNTPVPCERTRHFVTVQDNQDKVTVRVAQGESSQFGENQYLGEVTLTQIPASPRGHTKISITFGLDPDGILHVRAANSVTGQAATAELKLVGAPTGPEIQQMVARHLSKGALISPH